VALEPQDPAIGVADDHHVLGVLGQRAEAAAQHGQHAGERAALARLGERVGVERGPRA
jgi:hypothetical protein